MFAVANIKEALLLRNNQITTNILIFGSTNYEDLEICAKNNLTITIASYEWLANFDASKINLAENIKINVHLELDTGMYRYGINYKLLKKCLKMIKNHLIFNFVGIYTHYMSSEDSNITLKQFNIFKRAVNNNELVNLIKHCSNSYAALNFKEDYTDAVRVGIALYGLNRKHNNFELLKPLMTIMIKVTRCSKINKDTFVGYDCSFLSEEEGYVITTDIGYGDGLLRNYNYAAIYKNKILKKASNVCMNSIMFFSKEKINENEHIELQFDIDEIAENTKTIPYQIATNLMPQIDRKISS